MPNESIRQPSKVPDTSKSIDRSLLDAQVAHEQHIGYYLRKIEISKIDEEQQAVEAYHKGLWKLGFQLPGCLGFLIEQRKLSLGVGGVGPVYGKEVVTAGSWPIVMGNTEKISLIDRAMQFFGKGKPQEGSK
jgi:hypothetical protein